MHFIAIVLTAVAICIPAASATATCWKTSGCSPCESVNNMYSFATSYCTNYRNARFTTHGVASASSAGGWSSQTSCTNAFQGIISQCYGSNNGGVFDAEAHMTVSFCNCEIAKEAEAAGEIEA
ncbi:Alpha-galactosyl-binding lectin [Hypsizygus marmoreus]|uniref:Alpha-galactosyl-binding lectin n=1 Tax=Hypsizygus marmoreus TaxID=39966 RepID=A0A369JVR8_HYPMA|nr:Alpha-galactosyl-binding lectin [Hypsizygus marmoreus]